MRKRDCALASGKALFYSLWAAIMLWCWGSSSAFCRRC